MRRVIESDLKKTFKCTDEEAKEMIRLMDLPYEPGEDDWERMERIGDVINRETYSPAPLPEVFLDMHDTYAQTLVCRDGDFEIGDWGTFLEEYEQDREEDVEGDAGWGEDGDEIDEEVDDDERLSREIATLGDDED